MRNEASSNRNAMGYLASIFSPGSDRELHSLIACVCVLFEDLRIEIAGIYADDLTNSTNVTRSFVDDSCNSKISVPSVSGIQSNIRDTTGLICPRNIYQF